MLLAFRAVLLSGLSLVLSGCAPLSPQHPPALSFDVPAAWAQADAPVLGNPSSLAQWWLRFHDPLLAQLVSQALQANTSVRSAQAALRQARALRDVAAPACCRRSTVRRRRSAARSGEQHQQQLPGRPGRELGAGRLRRQPQRAAGQRGHRPGQRREPGRRAGVDRRRGGAGLHRAAQRPGAAGDRQRQPGQPAGDPADHRVAPAGGPGHVARSRAGARRDRADARPVAGAADQHRADAARAGGADRPAAGGAGGRFWPRRLRCRRRRTTWR